MLKNILSNGYLPKELPQPFSSNSFGDAIHNDYQNLPNLFSRGGHVTSTAIHNSSRPGLLRRKLGIPNPVNMFRLAEQITENWKAIESHVTASKLSLTTPQATGSLRALDRKHSLSKLPELMAEVRSKSRYVLNADISRFYHSIYTHSIPWAFHTKDTAKAYRSAALFGNTIDKLVRDAQDQQTMGIPIGPDSSLVIAESILTCIDKKLCSSGISNGLRYIDDYQLGFQSIGDAENAITLLQELLSEFELALNPLKTEIIELPSSFECLAISELRALEFRSTAGGQRSDILNYFNKSFQASKDYPKEPVLKFAVSRMASVDILEENHDLFESYIIQAAITQPSCLSYVINNLIKYKRIGRSLNIDRLNEVLNKIISSEASLGHGNEVANALWGAIVLSVPISNESATKVTKLTDPICATLLTDAKNKNLISDQPDWTIYENYMSKTGPKGEMWLFVYESLRRGWFSSIETQNPLTQNECFRFLKDKNVYFYDDSLSNTVDVAMPTGWSLYPGSVSG